MIIIRTKGTAMTSRITELEVELRRVAFDKPHIIPNFGDVIESVESQ